MSAKKSIFYGFAIALVLHIIVFEVLTLLAIADSQWALVQLKGVYTYWPGAILIFALTGFTMGRMIWDSVYRPKEELVDIGKGEFLWDNDLPVS